MIFLWKSALAKLLCIGSIKQNGYSYIPQLVGSWPVLMRCSLCGDRTPAGPGGICMSCLLCPLCFLCISIVSLLLGLTPGSWHSPGKRKLIPVFSKLKTGVPEGIQ